jgi:hypothetical protein
MPGTALTTASSIVCPHGGQAVQTRSSSVATAGAVILLETDVHDVIGCTFYNGSNYSPCLTIEWSAGANAVTVNGTKVLVRSSVGTCKNGQIVQGFALINSTQLPVTAR